MSEMPGWVADITVGQIMFTLAGIGALMAAWNKFFAPVLKNLRNFLDDWNGEEQRPGIDARKGVMSTLKDHGDAISAVKVQIEEIRSQVTPNHGSELKLSEELQQLRAEVRSAQSSIDAHLENVPVMVSEILDRANQNAADQIIAARAGVLQPPLFGDKEY